MKNYLNKLIIALDFNTTQQALDVVTELKEYPIWFKIGLELYISSRGKIIDLINSNNIFLDLKFHDIPNTVQQAVKNAIKPNVKMINVHASGGKLMMQRAYDGLNQAVSQLKIEKPKLIAVTLLTSIDNSILQQDFNLKYNSLDIVKKLALLTKESGLDGVVASANEASAIKEVCGQDFLVVTPGIRLATINSHDQKRIMTPKEAIRNGADYLVIGRDITQSANKISSIQEILNNINS